MYATASSTPNVFRPIVRMEDFDEKDGITYYFIGNSVTRSYAFTLCSMLANITSVPDRFVQRDLCGDSRISEARTERPRGCRAKCGPENVSVIFTWKNTISPYLSSDFRDACNIPDNLTPSFQGTTACLRRIFRT